MAHSLAELQSGKLLGTKRLKLACGLATFPQEILSLADTLEVLDLSDNNLTALPDNISQLKKLKVIFFERNHFVEFPVILKELPLLSMIGFKSNKMIKVPENAFPPLLRWLILTNNKITKIPKSIGGCLFLQKCALAGNQIEELPVEMASCVNLELLRTSANRLNSIPTWLFELPKLSWVAFGGNPCVAKPNLTTDIESFEWNDYTIEQLLGEGASGLIYKAHWNSQQKDLAIKVFKGDVTSDGLPEDEMAIAITAGIHDNLIHVLGKIKNHPEGKLVLLMKLISPSYVNLGSPPTLDTCTRDVFDKNSNITANQLLKIAKSITSVCIQLHCNGINHGDLYAHNIMIDNTADCILGDFGAASFYDVNSPLAKNIERVEVRAFGCLLEDILSLVKERTLANGIEIKWRNLINACTKSTVELRLSFIEILEELHKFQ